MLKAGLIGLVMLSLPACTKTPTAETSGSLIAAEIVKRFCAEIYLPITWSSRDTEQTRLEIRMHNARRDVACAVPSSAVLTGTP